MESEEEVRRRQKNEEKELEIHADKMRSMVPKKVGVPEVEREGRLIA